MLNAGIQLKAYGSRTMVANWWEERINLEAHLPKKRGITPATRDLDLDVHVMACETSPKWRQEEPSVQTTTYDDMTDQVWLDEKNHLMRKTRTAEARRRLEGAVSMRQVNVPSSTTTPQWLFTQFHDPHKTRFRSIYMRDYCKPELESTLGSGATRTLPDVPRRPWTVGTWTPGWGNSNK
jgi:hypothetical protein